jgi:heme exporter protein B
MAADLLKSIVAVVARDLLTAARRPADVLTPLVFFAIVVSLFPLAVSPEAAQLRLMGPGVLWVAALLATLLSLDRLFAHDLADGSLEQIVLAPAPLALLVFAKTGAHWLMSGLPLVIMAPLLALQLQLPIDALGTLVLSLALGTPVLSFLGAIGAALTLGLRGGGVLISLLVLPLYTPVLIFGAAAVSATAVGLDARPYLLLLAAMFVTVATFAPWATAAALRISLD